MCFIKSPSVKVNNLLLDKYIRPLKQNGKYIELLEIYSFLGFNNWDPNASGLIFLLQGEYDNAITFFMASIFNHYQNNIKNAEQNEQMRKLKIGQCLLINDLPKEYYNELKNAISGAGSKKVNSSTRIDVITTHNGFNEIDKKCYETGCNYFDSHKNDFNWIERAQKNLNKYRH